LSSTFSVSVKTFGSSFTIFSLASAMINSPN
jgi:hypothetical protein